MLIFIYIGSTTLMDKHMVGAKVVHIHCFNGYL